MKVKLHTTEKVATGLYRVAVSGGWLYCLYHDGVAITFVPDPNLEIE